MRVRTMRSADAEEVAALCEQLGYPSSATQVIHRFGLLIEQPEHGVFVAEDDALDERVIGWVHVHGKFLIESDPYAEISGLIVDERFRGQDVGHALLAEAEGWAQRRGYDEIRLRSNVVRDAAHAFYKRLGYSITKTSYLFRKML